jgi:hypothetical protein
MNATPFKGCIQFDEAQRAEFYEAACIATDGLQMKRADVLRL